MKKRLFLATSVAIAFGAAATLPEMPAKDAVMTADNVHVATAANEVTRRITLPMRDEAEPLTPPVYVGLDTPEEAELFTIIDHNLDRATWSYHPGTHAMMATFSYTRDMDDYLVSMPIRLEAGKAYEVSINAFCHKLEYGTEQVEIKYGTAPTAAAMTSTVVGPTEVNSTYYNPQTVSGNLIPPADGIYYIGIHGISPANRYILYVNHFRVAEGVVAGAPARPEDVTVYPDLDGAPEGSVTFAAPSTDLNGNRLTSLKAVVVETDSTSFTLDNPVPGGEYAMDITVPCNGTHTLRVYAVNEAGPGEVVEVSAFFGFITPMPPTALTIEEAPATGDVTLTWLAPVTDIEGNPISDCTYNVYSREDNERVLVASGVDAISLTLEGFVPTRQQRFVQFYVMAVRGDAESTPALTPMIPVGTPYSTPFNFSFNSDDFSNYQIKTNTSGGATWAIASDATLGIPAQDGDNALGVVTAQYQGYFASLYTGKISLRGLQQPRITVWEYRIDDEDANTTAISVICDNNETVLLTASNEDAPVWSGWYAHEVDVRQYAGKDIQVGITATIRTNIYSIFDNITVEEVIDDAVETVAADNATVVLHGNSIVIDGAAGSPVKVHTPDGRPVASATGDTTITLPAGIYLVTVGTATTRVAIR